MRAGVGLRFRYPHLHPEATMPLTDTSASAARLVDEFFAEPIEALLAAAVTFGVELDGQFDRGAVRAVQLDDLVEPYSERLRSLPGVRVFGAGFVAARGAFGDTAGHLSWWQGDPVRKLVLAAQSVNKEHIDYTALEWFRVPAQTGQPHVAGPYVDYLCNDEYTVTIAVPVVLERGFVGVLALDVLVDTVERELLPRLGELASPLVVVNRARRVLVSTDPAWETGDTGRDAGAVVERPDAAGCGHGFTVLASGGR